MVYGATSRVNGMVARHHGTELTKLLVPTSLDAKTHYAIHALMKTDGGVAAGVMKCSLVQVSTAITNTEAEGSKNGKNDLLFTRGKPWRWSQFDRQT